MSHSKDDCVHSGALGTPCTFLGNTIPEAFALIRWELPAESEEVSFHPGILHNKRKKKASIDWHVQYAGHHFIKARLGMSITTPVSHMRKQSQSG